MTLALGLTILPFQVTWAGDTNTERATASTVSSPNSGPLFQDLSSLDPVVRANAAAQIKQQKLYHETDSDRWLHVESHVKKGDSMESVLNRFRQAGGVDVPNSTHDIPPTCNFAFQLDDSWMLVIYYKNYVLQERHLIEAPRQVPVKPPANYTGLWLIYRLDGTACREYYRDGEPMPVH